MVGRIAGRLGGLQAARSLLLGGLVAGDLAVDSSGDDNPSPSIFVALAQFFCRGHCPPGSGAREPLKHGPLKHGRGCGQGRRAQALSGVACALIVRRVVLADGFNLGIVPVLGGRRGSSRACLPAMGCQGC